MVKIRQDQENDRVNNIKSSSRNGGPCSLRSMSGPKNYERDFEDSIDDDDALESQSSTTAIWPERKGVAHQFDQLQYQSTNLAFSRAQRDYFGSRQHEKEHRGAN